MTHSPAQPGAVCAYRWRTDEAIAGRNGKHLGDNMNAKAITAAIDTIREIQKDPFMARFGIQAIQQALDIDMLRVDGVADELSPFDAIAAMGAAIQYLAEGKDSRAKSKIEECMFYCQIRISYAD